VDTGGGCGAAKPCRLSPHWVQLSELSSFRVPHFLQYIFPSLFDDFHRETGIIPGLRSNLPIQGRLAITFPLLSAEALKI